MVNDMRKCLEYVSPEKGLRNNKIRVRIQYTSSTYVLGLIHILIHSPSQYPVR